MPAGPYTPNLRFQTVLNRVISGPDRCTRTFTRHILTLTEKINGDELLYTTSESVTTFLSDPAELSMTLLHTEGVCCTLQERNTCLTKRDSLSIVEPHFIDFSSQRPSPVIDTDIPRRIKPPKRYTVISRLWKFRISVHTLTVLGFLQYR